MAIRITCINKDAGDHENPYVAIRTLGWINVQTSETGRSTRVVMHDWVQQGNLAYVEQGGYQARLVAMVSPRGNKYVKTQADITRLDNLLALPECP